MREEHEDAVETAVEVGVAFWLEELQAQVGEDGGFEELDELVDLDEHVDCHFDVGEGLEEVVGLFVGLGEQAEGDCCDGVVAPGAEEGDEEGLAVSAVPGS